ncbi:glycosyltransferase [Cryptosporangium aurantiacum]|uniref:Trehalose synthase n=1 Tax=Cryptosporangium aurantiacum TaxID=134849 RepID=A0A1M7R8Z3_9ACTN|nr:glycosyltransferase [Cryptosporangium aurantiacum]SHN42610.1 trehalose synthase [Cryptosporangium aurantiacum]
MSRLYDVTPPARDPRLLEQSIGAERYAAFAAAGRDAAERFAGRKIVNINSTPAGGGVAEMLESLVSYARGLDIDAQWHVIEGDERFFEITKRIHNHIYGLPGDDGPLGEAEHADYFAVHQGVQARLAEIVGPDDIVVVHDPQPAGLVPLAKQLGVPVLWRCHIGVDVSTPHDVEGWEFIRRYVEPADTYLLTRVEYAPDWMERGRLRTLRSSIDPMAPKNRPLEPQFVRDVLAHYGLIAGSAPAGLTFTRKDGSTSPIARRADILQAGPPAPADAPLVVQISRWDRMKDMPGVARAFADHLLDTDAHLALVGPAISGYADDPEGAEQMLEAMSAWRALPGAARERIHLACIPMTDLEENALVINALQRHAAVITQKSISEGFGLTVVEAMLKGTPVVGSTVGGLLEQIVDAESGLLVEASDLAGFADALRRLLTDADYAAKIGDAGRERALDLFTADRHLARYGKLIGETLARR